MDLLFQIHYSRLPYFMEIVDEGHGGKGNPL